MITTNITDFRANAKQYVDSIINNNGTLLINRGNTAAVLISLEEYNSIKATEGVLLSPTSTEVMAGVEQWENGECVEVDLALL